MSNFRDEELNQIRQSLEQTEEYMGQIAAGLDRLIKLFEKEFNGPTITGEWKKLS